MSYVAIVTVVDSQGRGYCAKTKFSELEFSVLSFYVTSVVTRTLSRATRLMSES